MTVHNFAASLRRSHGYADAPWWGQVYRRAFPGLEYIQDLREHGWWQNAGIDRRIFLPNKTFVTVDEKVREQDRDDFFLEAFSEWHGSKESSKPGWIEYAACDYIAYAFAPSRRCYLLPMRELHRVWVERRSEWWVSYPPLSARNQVGKRTWVTVGVAVPIDEVLDAIRGCTLIRWDP